MYYRITGHILEISGEEPGLNVPGFSPFVFDAILTVQPLISIQLNQKVAGREAGPLYQFTIEEGNCEFLKCKDSYLIRWKEPDGTSWLMDIEYKEGRFVGCTDMNKDTDAHIISFSIWIAFGIAALHYQTVAIHASAIIHNGKSILFLGESGTGKSTQSGLWLQHIPNTELLNDDSPIICIANNEIAQVYGSPWSGKTPCYKDKQSAVAAFIRLRQAPNNSIRRLRTIEAIAALQPSLPPILASEPILVELMLDCLSAILKQIPVYALDCLPDIGAVNLVYFTLKDEGRL